MGYYETTRSKPIIIDGIAAYLDFDRGNPDPYLPDAELISELQTYGILENGSTVAQVSCFDDRVISFALALHASKFSGIARFFPGAA